MQAGLIVVLMCLAAGLGLYLLTLHVRGVRKPVLIGVHVILGFFATEQTVVTIKGSNYGDLLPPQPAGDLVACFLGLALFAGLVGPLFQRKSPHVTERILIAHITLGAAALVLALRWASTL